MAETDGQQLLNKRRLPTSELPAAIAGFSGYKTLVISSVVPAMNPLFETLKPAANVVFVTAANLPGLTLNLIAKEQVGADRIVNALAAWKATQTDCLVVDSGTAITFCLVRANGVYEGGAIFPGMGIASKALSLFTAQIPEIQVSPQEPLYGKNTQQAVEVGLYQGYIHLINGFIAAYRAQFSGIVVVGAGSGLDVLANRLDIDQFDLDLTLKGLLVILQTL